METHAQENKNGPFSYRRNSMWPPSASKHSATLFMKDLSASASIAGMNSLKCLIQALKCLYTGISSCIQAFLPVYRQEWQLEMPVYRHFKLSLLLLVCRRREVLHEKSSTVLGGWGRSHWIPPVRKGAILFFYVCVFPFYTLPAIAENFIFQKYILFG